MSPTCPGVTRFIELKAAKLKVIPPAGASARSLWSQKPLIENVTRLWNVFGAFICAAVCQNRKKPPKTSGSGRTVEHMCMILYVHICIRSIITLNSERSYVCTPMPAANTPRTSSQARRALVLSELILSSLWRNCMMPSPLPWPMTSGLGLLVPARSTGAET